MSDTIETEDALRLYAQVGRAAAAEAPDYTTTAVAYIGAVTSAEWLYRHTGEVDREALIAERVGVDPIAAAAAAAMTERQRINAQRWVTRHWIDIVAEAQAIELATPLLDEWETAFCRTEVQIREAQRQAGAEAALAEGTDVAAAVIAAAAAEARYLWMRPGEFADSAVELAQMMLLDPLVQIALEEIGVARALFLIRAIDARWDAVHERGCTIYGLRLWWEAEVRG